MTAVQSLILNFELTRRHVSEVLPTLGKTFRLVRRRKNSASEKKKSSPTKFDFLKVFGLKINFEEVRPLFDPFCTKLGQIRPQLCPAANAAEQPASRQHSVLSDGLEEIKAQLPRYSAHKIRIKLDFHSRLRSIQCQFCPFWLYTVKTFDKRIN